MSEALTGAFSTALTAIQTDVTSLFTTALPIALGIMAIPLALRIGISFFRSIAN